MGACSSAVTDDIDEDERMAYMSKSKRSSSYGGLVLRNQLGEDGNAVTVESLYDVSSTFLCADMSMKICNANKEHHYCVRN